MASDAQAKATKKYHDKFDSILLRVPKGEKDLIAAHAQSMGETVNKFICRAINDAIEKDCQKQ